MMRTFWVGLFIVGLLAGCSSATPPPTTGDAAGAIAITVYRSPT